MRKNTLLFDFDLTLADSSQGIFKCINYALDKMNYPEHDYDSIKLTIGHSLPKTFRMLTKTNANGEAETFVRLFVEKADEIMNANTNIYSEVYEIMPKLKAKGFKTGIISTKYRYRIDGVLKREKLSDYFDTIVGGEDVKEHKPHPEGLLLAIEKLEINKEQAIYIGDSLVDAGAAKSADIDFIAVLTGTVSKTSFDNENCKSIEHLNHLLQLI